MIVTLTDAQKVNPDITKIELDAIEQQVRTLTNNNFHNRNKRITGLRFNETGLMLVYEAKGFEIGATIEINNSRYNDGVYTIINVDSEQITFDKATTYEYAPDAMMTKVEYPADIVVGVIKLLKYEQKMATKIGIKSETVSRMSTTYFDVNSADNVEGLPASVWSFLKKYKKLRWS